jgi:hypothetical protein
VLAVQHRKSPSDDHEIDVAELNTGHANPCHEALTPLAWRLNCFGLDRIGTDDSGKQIIRVTTRWRERVVSRIQGKAVL